LTEASCHASSVAVKLFPALAVLLLGCPSPKHWPPRPAEHPATRAELAAYELTVRGPPGLARAFSDLGFRVVDHPPYHLQLEVTLTREGDQLVATLRSDGFFVDEALGSSLDALARTLAVSARVAEFIRNSGLPQQLAFPN
jgi:hypothetical protein